MKWITRSHVHVDRVACPWLITRFIDSDAEFLFVSKSKVMELAEKNGAIPFDTPGAELHHRDDLCTFDVIIKDYGLTDNALLRMAKVPCRRWSRRGRPPRIARVRTRVPPVRSVMKLKALPRSGRSRWKRPNRRRPTFRYCHRRRR